MENNNFSLFNEFLPLYRFIELSTSMLINKNLSNGRKQINYIYFCISVCKPKEVKTYHKLKFSNFISEIFQTMIEYSKFYLDIQSGNF